jgi:hypothetical protein
MSKAHDDPTLRPLKGPSVPPPLPYVAQGGDEVVGLIHRELHRLSLRVGGRRSDLSVDNTEEGWTACGWVEGLDDDGTFQPYIWIASNAREGREGALGELLGRLLEVLS